MVLTMAEFLVLQFIAGAFARRSLGSTHRYISYPLIVLSSGILPTITALALKTSWWAALLIGLGVGAAALLFLVRGFVTGPIDQPTPARVWKKYGPFALGYWAAWKWWPERWKLGGLIDGPYAVGELFLGGSLYVTVDAASVLVWQCLI